MSRLGIIGYFTGDVDFAQTYWQKSFYLYERAKHELGISRSLNNLALIERLKFNYAESIELQKRSIEINKNWHDSQRLASGLNNLAFTYYLNQQFDAAIDTLNETIPISIKIGNRESETVSHLIWGHVDNRPQKYRSSYMHFRRALEISREVSILSKSLESIVGIASHIARKGERKRAYKILRFVHNHPAHNQLVARFSEPLLDQLTEDLPPSALAELDEESRPLEIEAVSEALLIDRIFF